MTSVEFTTIAIGEYSGICTAGNVVISSREVWERLWTEHTSDVSPPVPLPLVNFNTALVVGVFSGQKPTSGYAIIIERIRTRTVAGGSAVLVVEFREETPDSFAQDVITCPHHIVKVHGDLRTLAGTVEFMVL